MSSPDHHAPSLVAHLSPLQRGPAATALRDLALAVGWSDLRVLDLAGTQWSVLVGHKRKEDPLRAVLPLPLHTNALVPSELHVIFGALAKVTVDDLPAPLPAFAPSVKQLQAAYAAVKEGGLGAVAEGEEDEEGKAGQDDKEAKGGDNEESAGGALQDEGAEDEEGKESAGEDGPEDDPDTFDNDTLYTAIMCADSTVVYYKLSRGIRKPHDIPDE